MLFKRNVLNDLLIPIAWLVSNGLRIKGIHSTADTFIKYVSPKYASKSSAVMKVLNVAEKNDAAKNIANILSGGVSRWRDGYSVYNKIYEFECTVSGQKRAMKMTSVSGHILNYEFTSTFRSWQKCDPVQLFDAPVVKGCTEDAEKIKKTLEKEASSAQALIIWTDCDREGENIGYEIISICTAVKPSLKVYRAKFSEITRQSIWYAIENLIPPNQKLSNAVDVRSELDLRIGAAFTRFQTMRLQKVFPNQLANLVISYGSCQFPTLGFVVERYNAVQSFVPEPFWKIKVEHMVKDLNVEFTWKRVRLFDEQMCRTLFEKCLEDRTAKVVNVTSKPKSKWRPLPLDTVEFEKIASRKLGINAKEAMRIAEKLYTQGAISYPRTETNIFPKQMDLASFVRHQTEDGTWGEFAERVLEDGPNPRQGKKTDEAHPPIHPTKYVSLFGNEQKVYEYIVRHFLACVSKDAKGHETIVEIDINNEKFVANGLMILEHNYLDVYPYEKWNAKEIHEYRRDQTFRPTEVSMVDGQTSPPNLLTEADLIALMEKHGIGTDATHAEHIEKIKSRLYVGLTEQNYFIPGQLGMGLVEGYDNMGFEMSKPNLRASLEADLKGICEGLKDPQAVLQAQVQRYKQVYIDAAAQVDKIDMSLAKYLEAIPIPLESSEAAPQPYEPVLKCPACGLDMVIHRRNNGAYFVSCVGFPNCKTAIWFPASVTSVKATNLTCGQCGPPVKKLDFKFRPGTMAPYYPNSYVGCVNGCDKHFLSILNIRPLQATADPTRTGVGTATRGGTGGTTRGGYSGAGGGRGGGGYGGGRGRNDDGNDAAGGGFGGGGRDDDDNDDNDDDFYGRRGGGRGSSYGAGRGSSFTQKPSSGFGGSGQAQTIERTRPPPAPRLTQRPPFQFNTQSNDRRQFNNQGQQNANNGDVMCNCGEPARRFIVQKESVNKGRPFYKCAKMGSEACSFFQWDDELGNNQATSNNRRFKEGGPSQNWRGRNSGESSNLRKCSLCHQTGHTKRNCPNQ